MKNYFFRFNAEKKLVQELVGLQPANDMLAVKGEEKREISRAIDKMIAYAEELPSTQNADANAIKTMIHDLFIDQLTQAQHERLKRVGRKDTPLMRAEISHNNKVQIHANQR